MRGTLWCCIIPWLQPTDRFMFSILRFILIVGTIFYFSPVRQRGEGTAAVEAIFTPKKAEPATGSAHAIDNSAQI
jgi:hypothetical protein